MKNKKILLIVLGILLSLSLIVGASYAYYMVTASQTNKNHLASSCISVSLTNEKNDITLNNAYPITDSEGKKLTPYQFTITNTCDIFISYNVNLEMLEGTDLSSEYIKTMVNNEAPAILSSLDNIPTTIDKSTESRILAQGSLGSNDSVDYALRLWMDENTPLNDDTQDKSLISKIVVVAQPSTYKPVDYVSTLHDAILVNEYSVTDVNNAVNKIESKGTPDLNKTAPIITWKETKTNDTKSINVDMPHPDLIGNASLGGTNLNEKSSNINIGTEYSFDSTSGYYKLVSYDSYGASDIKELDFLNNTYYTCGGTTNIKADGTVSSTSPISCKTVYKIKSVETTTFGSSTSNGYRLRYIISGNEYSSEIAESDKSDKGLYKDIDDLGNTYYYRGNVTNNNVYFANNYWKIIRINGDGTIRMIYSGATLNSAEYVSTKFNELSDNPAYVGYMYGTTDGQIGTREYNISNGISSTIKIAADNFYEKNLKDSIFKKYLADSGFCGDRSIYTGNGYDLSSPTVFGTTGRYYSKTYTLKCKNLEDDLYTTTSSSNGNKALTYPIGLITSDEVIYSGMTRTDSNPLNWLYINKWFWTMSPSAWTPEYSKASVWNVYSTANSNASWVSNSGYLRPVINLKSDVEISGGIGTINDPFIVKTN